MGLHHLHSNHLCNKLNNAKVDGLDPFSDRVNDFGAPNISICRIISIDQQMKLYYKESST